MVATGNNDGTAGWGAFLPEFLTLPVVNEAVAGRSARSFTREGRFGAIANNVTNGDFVVIEFGHNDGNPLVPVDNGRSDCSPMNGTGYDTTCTTTYNGTEYVLTYTRYLTNAALLYRARGVNVIISTATTNNLWETGNFTYTANRFVQYARDAAHESSSTFVDHGQAMADAYKALGPSAVDAFYPHDHTHTSPAGAEVVAKAFVTALEYTKSKLKKYVDN
ncbi:hypothetical protein LTR86_011156 [Recurvomyces mirabilis]|nr:hypothetical protein LTR86_011156 [Recurvomyces mirabilis]